MDDPHIRTSVPFCISMTVPSTLQFSTALFLAALVPRLGYLWEHRASPFFAAPVVDARTFLTKAQAIAGGDLWGGPEPFWQPPLYIYLLAFVCWLLPASYFVGIRLLHASSGALTCALVYFVARRAFGERIARIAGIATAACGSFIYFEGELLAVPVEIVLNLLLLHRLTIALAHGRQRDWLLSGLLAGLSALTRPNILLFAAVFCAWTLWRKSAVWSQLTLFTGIALLVVLPVSWRNWTTEPDPVLISANGGVNFYIGNNADYHHTVSLHPGMAWDDMVMEPVRAGHTTAAAKSDFFLRKGLAYIAAEPFEWLGLLAHKAYHFWSGPELKRNQDIYYARQHSWILSLLLWDWHLSFPFGLIGPLSLVGLVLSLRERDPPTSLLRLYVLCYTASVLLFFPAARYRMPLLPVLIVFAAFATWCLYLAIRRKNRPIVAGLTVPLAGLLVLLNWPRAAPSATDAQLQFDLGEVHLRQGDYAQAEHHSTRALELEPNYNYARHNLAVAYFHQERYQDSEREALATAAENPLRPDTQVLLGRIYLARNESQRAAVHLRRALDIEPDSGMARYYYGHLLYRQGRHAQAIPHLQAAQTWQPRDFWISYELGRAQHRAGNEDAALVQYRRALAIEQRPQALVAIAALHLIAGRRNQARTHLQAALELDAENPEALINLALLDYQDGNSAKALDRLDRILARRPSPQAERLRAEIRRQEAP